MRTSEWIRFKDGLWIPYRKRTYLYWFKFLQEAERAPNNEFEVDWSKYRGWGGANAVMGQKFDVWWDERWAKLFGSKDRWMDKGKMKFDLTTTRPKADGIRIALLVYQSRNTPPDLTPRNTSTPDGMRRETTTKRRGGRNLAIARKVIQLEKRKATPLWGINLEAGEEQGLIEQEVQSRVGRHLRNANKILANVCEGRFP
jgi:hypothetical protein